MKLGTTIKSIRNQRGQTQEEFASNCGITQTYLSQIENDLKEPTLPVLKSMSKQLEIPLPILFFLSTTEEDIPENKREAFTALNPAIKSLVNEFFAV